ncbi:MAG: T9SS type A sorting domain-containing protein [Candidatus Electryonea clarkiae]|nr:T9SS type A sorting domain-containing protein [Candidatus Electryonea clarkiae]MDP8288832.1 T9SS type A sorting domain-containing protein [Candidatus Electryonea clarkiae]
MNRLILGVLFIHFCLVSTLPVFAQDSLNMRLIDGKQLLGSFFDVAAFGEYTLAASWGSGLLTISGVAEGNPEIVGVIEESNPIFRIIVNEPMVLVIGVEKVLYDFSDPLHPVRTGTLDPDVIAGAPIVIWQDSLLIINSYDPDLIQICDLEDDGTVTVLSTIDPSDYVYTVYDLEYYNNRLYLGYIYSFTPNPYFDLSDPSNPVLHSFSEDVNIKFRYIEIEDDIAAVFGDSTFAILDISDPHNAVVLDTLIKSHFPQLSYYLHDRTIYAISSEPDSIFIMQYDDNYQLSMVNRIQAPDYNLEFQAFQGDYAIWGAGSNGIGYMNISDPAAIEGYNFWAMTDGFNGGALIDNYFVLASRRPTIRNFPILFNGMLGAQDSVSLDGWKYCDIVGDFGDLLLTHWYKNISGNVSPEHHYRLFGIDSQNLGHIGFRGILPSNNYEYYDNPWEASQKPFTLVSENLIYSVTRDSDEVMFHIYDISDPDIPFLANKTPANKRFSESRICSNDEYLFYGGYSPNWSSIATIDVYSIADPLNPQYLGELEFNDNYYYLRDINTLRDNYVLIRDDDRRYVCTIDNPLHPEVVSTIPKGNPFQHEFSFNNDYLVLNDSDQTLGSIIEVYDLNNMNAPERIGYHSGYFYDCELSGNKLYAVWWNGYGVYELSNIEAPPPTVWIQPWLESIWPNPFSKKATIKVAVPTPTRLTITLYDILGREAVTIIDGYYTNGYKYFTLDSDNLASGNYFMIGRDKTEVFTTQRITIVK